MLDVGDTKMLKKVAEFNSSILKQGYDVVSPIPTCSLMIEEYKNVINKEIKVYDAMEYLLKLNREGKIKLPRSFNKTVLLPS